MCFLDGKLELGTFTDEKVNQPKVQEALSKVQVICDDKIPEPGPYCPVSVDLKDGQYFTFTATIAKGHPKNPMTESEVEEKFLGNAKCALTSRQAEELAALVRHLESVEDVRRLTGGLTPA